MKDEETPVQQSTAAQNANEEARKISDYSRVVSENERIIYSAIIQTLDKSQYVDYSVTPDDIFSEVAFLIYQRLDSLLRVGSAKLSTRLFALARRHVYFYYIKPHIIRVNAVTRRLDKGQDFDGVECLSDVELASIRAAETEQGMAT
jgi:hypothetical protein